MITQEVEKAEWVTLLLHTSCDVDDKRGVVGRLGVSIVDLRLTEVVQPLEVSNRVINFRENAVVPTFFV